VAAQANAAPVTVAFALGWHVAELYSGHLGAAEREPVEPPDTLPGLSDLLGYDLVELSLTQIGAELQLLAGSFGTATGIQLPTLADFVSKREGHNAKALRLAIRDFHVELLEKLTAADFRLGKAYGLGRALADTVLLPAVSDPDTLRDAFGAGVIGTLSQWLDELATAFPPYAAPATRASLQTWSSWVADPKIGGAAVEISTGGGDLTRALHGQGRLWRSLLSDEKRGVDLLGVDDYVDAAVGLVRRTSKIAMSFLRAWWWVAVILVAIAALAAWLIFAHLSGSSQTATAIISFLGLLGVSWKGIEASLGKVLARVEPPLWDAEVEAAVCRAVTRLPSKWPTAKPAGRVESDRPPAVSAPASGSAQTPPEDRP
jgi:hypothetical protein